MAQIAIDKEQVAAFCRAHRIRRLSLFGSVLRPDFGPDSDVDVLVEFDPGHAPGMFGMVRLEKNLASILGGRKIDLRTPEELSRYFRHEVLRAAEVQYAQG